MSNGLLNRLLPKPKKAKFTLPLRDPINTKLFKIFLGAAGNNVKYNKDLKCAQLIIAYTILYHTGFKTNKIRQITKEQIEDAIKASQISVIHHKTKQP